MHNHHRFLALDSFRGICALFVAIYHMTFLDSLTETKFFQHSELFVDFFFILSGFVLAHAYINKDNIKGSNFFVSRIFRLMPLHVSMLSIFLFLELALLILYQQGYTLRGDPFSGKNSVSEIIPNLLLIHSWTSLTNKLSFNGPSWSISVELFLYIVFFFGLFFKKEFRPIVFSCLFLLLIFACITKQSIFNESIDRGMLGFSSGIITYYVTRKNSHKQFSTVIATTIEIAAICLTYYAVQNGGNSLITTAIFCLTVFTFSFEQGLVSRLLRATPFVYLGLLSYSIYMTHYLIISVFKSLVVLIQNSYNITLTSQIGSTKYIDLGSSMTNNLSALLLVLIVIAVSHFTYRYIEKPGIKIGKKISHRA